MALLLIPPCFNRWGVPQGSVIGPLLFICYTTPIQGIVHSHGFPLLMYADDSQLYITVKPTEIKYITQKLDTGICLQNPSLDAT